jgi:hypothetical protein
MNRLARSDFPAELLLLVVEATVLTQVGHWNVTYSQKLDALAVSLFARPQGVTTATLGILQQAAETALLSRGIVRIPADLDYGLPLEYDIPPALLGRENHVRHLVIDFEIVADKHSGVLSAAIDHMAMLAEAFPRLTVCVFLLQTEYNSYGMRHDSTKSVEAKLLALQGYTLTSQGIISECTLEDNLVDFIAAFARDGPGKRKLIRFSRQRVSFLPSTQTLPVPRRKFRPLVRVSRLSSTTDATEDASVDEAMQSINNAKQILNEAFRGPWKSR